MAASFSRESDATVTLPICGPIGDRRWSATWKRQAAMFRPTQTTAVFSFSATSKDDATLPKVGLYLVSLCSHYFLLCVNIELLHTVPN